MYFTIISLSGLCSNMLYARKQIVRRTNQTRGIKTSLLSPLHPHYLALIYSQLASGDELRMVWHCSLSHMIYGNYGSFLSIVRSLYNFWQSPQEPWHYRYYTPLFPIWGTLQTASVSFREDGRKGRKRQEPHKKIRQGDKNLPIENN